MIIKNDSTLLIMIMNIIIIMEKKIPKQTDPTPPLEDDWFKIEQNLDPPEDGWYDLEKKRTIAFLTINNNGNFSSFLLSIPDANNPLEDMIRDTSENFPIDETSEDETSEDETLEDKLSKDELSGDELSGDEPLENEFAKARRQRVAKILMEEHSSTNCKNFFGGFDGNCVKPGCGAKSDCHPAIHTFKPIRTGGLICWCGKLEHLHPSKKH